MSKTVIRYVPTFVGANGLRTLASPAQGRWTWATPEGAQAYIDAVLANTSFSTVLTIWGENPRFEVRACQCWAGHFDPVGVYFDFACGTCGRDHETARCPFRLGPPAGTVVPGAPDGV